MQYNQPLNLSGMSPSERKAYALWIRSEEEQLRRLRNPAKRELANKYHSSLNRLVRTLLKD